MLPIHCRQRIRMRELSSAPEQSRVVAFFGLGKTPQVRRSARIRLQGNPTDC
jgi:hypothetical protein